MRILFLFIGEPHHVFHALPIAAEMQRSSPHVDVEIAVASAAHRAQIARVREAYPELQARVTLLKRPFQGPAFRNMWLGRSQMRLPTLLGALPYLRGFDAIVVPERTSTILKPFLGDTKLIFTPHGAGDRAIMLDPRDARFDFVLVAGEKSERRLRDAGTIRPGAYGVPGYVKLDLLRRLHRPGHSSFGNGRPTVLYAPHFRRSLSSWDGFARGVIEAFRAQDRYNLVVAPHIRLFHAASAAEKAQWEALAEPGRIIVDLGSPKLTDMSWIGEADIYMGDVSSQVYEFLGTPRPCVFLDAHGADWRGNPDYLFWTLGEVVSRIEDVLPAVARAGQRHPEFRALQAETVAASFGGDPAGAAGRSAAMVLEYLRGAGARQDRLAA